MTLVPGVGRILTVATVSADSNYRGAGPQSR